LETILFLRNLIKIKWRIGGTEGKITKEILKNESDKQFQKIALSSFQNGEKYSKEYLVFHKPFQIEGHRLAVKTAFFLEKSDDERICVSPVPNTRLVVFFPTERNTFLNFFIHGPFKTTPNRENIPMHDAQNQKILSLLSDLVAESIPTIRDIGLLDVSFLEVLPIKCDLSEEIIFQTVFQKVKEKFLSGEKLLPTADKRFDSTENVLLARGKDLIKLLNRKEFLRILFNKEKWLDANITIDRTKELRDYLINELSINEVDFPDFAKNISEDFMQKVDDKWIINFYRHLSSRSDLWEKPYWYSWYRGILRQKPIIRLIDNSHINPCDENDRIQVFFPSETDSGYYTIKEIFFENEESRTFLEQLGVTQPDIFSELRQIVLPKYGTSNPSVDFYEYSRDLKKLYVAFTSENTDQKNELAEEIKEFYIVLAEENSSNNSVFLKPEDVYIPSNDLLEFFHGFTSAFFISSKIKKDFKNLNEFENFFLSIGCHLFPKRFQIPSRLNWEEKKFLREKKMTGWFTREEKPVDFDLDGLDNFLKNLTLERSLLLWNFLLYFVQKSTGTNKDSFFKGVYSWFYYTEYSASFDSVFLKTLRETPWLFDKGEVLHPPSEMDLESLHDQYKKNDENVEFLIDHEILRFRSDEIKRIEEKYKGRLISNEEYEELQRLKEEHLAREMETAQAFQEDAWSPEFAPDEVTPHAFQDSPVEIDSPDLRGQRPSIIIGDETYYSEVPTEEDVIEDDFSPLKIKKIGRWGEEFVNRFLLQIIIEDPELEVYWLNEDGDVGKGYDFIISKDGFDFEYIEVKTKLVENPRLIKITGPQWEFARKLYNHDEGEKYKLYIVKNAGSNSAGIRILENPVKLWKEGKIYAHPVNLKL